MAEGFLIITGVTAPASAHVGDLVNFTIHTKNTGASDNFKIELSGSLTGSQEFSLEGGGKCVGTAISCSSLPREEFCLAQCGCSWGGMIGIVTEGCSGTACPCSSFNTKEACESQGGCSWQYPTKDVNFSFTMPNYNISITIKTYHYEEAVGWVWDTSSVWELLFPFMNIKDRPFKQ